MLNKINFFVSFFSFIGYFVGLTLIIFLGYIESSRYYSLPLRFLLSLIMFIYIVQSKYKYAKSNRLYLYAFWAFWTFYLYAIIKSLYLDSSEFRITPITYVAYSLLYGIIPFLFFSLKHTEKSLTTFKNAIVFSGVILSILIYFLYIELFALGVGRISSAKYILGNEFESISPLVLSYSSSLIIAICTFYISFLKLSKETKFYYILAIGISLIPFFLGASRGSVIALVFSFVFVLFFRGSFKAKLGSIVLTVLLGITMVFLSNYFGSIVFYRVLNISEDIKSSSMSVSRLELWSSAWNQFLDSPILGDSIQSILPPHPHNIFLESLMAVGVLGTIPLLFLIMAAYRKGIKIIKYSPEHGWTIILFLQGFIQHMFSGTIYTAIFFWAGMGLVFSIRGKEEASNRVILLNNKT